MHLLAVFAALVWIGAWTFRRRVLGFAILIVAPIGFWLILSLIERMASIGPSKSGGPTLLQLFAAIFEAIVLTVGLMLVLQSRVTYPRACRHCRYDLAGNITGVCPECGGDVSDHPHRTFHLVCPTCGLDLGPGEQPACPACARAAQAAVAVAAEERALARSRARATLAARARHRAESAASSGRQQTPRRHRRS